MSLTRRALFAGAGAVAVAAVVPAPALAVGDTLELLPWQAEALGPTTSLWLVSWGKFTVETMTRTNEILADIPWRET